MWFVHLLALFVTPLLVLAYPSPQKMAGDYGSHDPSMCKDASGTYFVFATAIGISIRTSKDRINWEYIGTVWAENQDTWTDQWTDATNANIWAPDCHIVNGEFLLYYTASTGKLGSAIFLAKSKTGLPGSWTNEGTAVITKPTDNYNAVDANLLIDQNGNWHMSFGSWYAGIEQMTLDPSTGKPSSTAITHLAERFADNKSLEAAYIFFHNGFYYLFNSWDYCCNGINSTYNIHVTRSTSPSGPFVDDKGVAALKGGGTLVLQSHGSIIGPGGQSIFQDDDGILLVYHYYTATASLLAINHLDFSSGWPVVTA